MVPNECGYEEHLAAYARAYRDVFHAQRQSFCVSTVSNIMIILQSDAVGYNVICVYRLMLPKF